MYILLAIGVMALVTYLPRVIPLILMKKKIQSKFVQSFLYYVPYTVLAAMTFPAIFNSTGSLLSGIVGAGISIGLAYLGGSLLQVSIVAVIAVYIMNLF
ncbi:AzlD domain-containing protein [Niameybacter massiliensis]|uniref:AzlD domain-containing protein n=1 Tax=Holtiella tumoricola TaxID=3018743 RepID=A0AA42DP93_9FIRM|nr:MULTISPECIES: AzlD domain-containing protein [Lachnospirales]MDA3732638.1 AzlD domain-containing protein [Holtiella tumoricola]